ncbi:MepB family protein [Mycetocola saprophilus]|uniref:MepB family protein n=1 Tax=Mycetocola saprophilus TaxID=76636 RepID=UPI003BEFE7C9
MDPRLPPWWGAPFDAADVTHARVEDDVENADYAAGIVTLGSARWRIRTARITPTKPGGFVSAWRRGDDGITEPFTADPTLAGMIVFIEDRAHRGAFIWDTAKLTELGILRSSAHPGKRGFRVYPSWCTGLNRQAEATQRHQAAGFVDLSWE